MDHLVEAHPPSPKKHEKRGEERGEIDNKKKKGRVVEASPGSSDTNAVPTPLVRVRLVIQIIPRSLSGHVVVKPNPVLGHAADVVNPNPVFRVSTNPVFRP